MIGEDVTVGIKAEAGDIEIKNSPDGFVRIYRKEKYGKVQLWGGDAAAFQNLYDLMEEYMNKDKDLNK